MVDQAIALLEQQQSGVKARSPQWMVAEQLKDLCRREPQSAELIAQDLENPAMSIVEAEKRLKVFADKHKTGNFSCVTPLEAERILREFYGLPDPAEGPEAAQFAGAQAIDLADFLMGPPAKPADFVGRGGARERRGTCPEGGASGADFSAAR